MSVAKSLPVTCDACNNASAPPVDSGAQCPIVRDD